MLTKPHAPAALVACAMLLAGCAEGSLGEGGSNLTTASVAEPRPDPACLVLASQIDSLKKEGVADKVAQASIKKYKMTTADLAKADQLNRSNAEFQFKCSTVKPAPGVQSAAASQTSSVVAAKSAPAAKATARPPAKEAVTQ